MIGIWTVRWTSHPRGLLVLNVPDAAVLGLDMSLVVVESRRVSHLMEFRVF